MAKLTKNVETQQWVIRNEENKVIMVQMGREVFYLKHAFTIESPEELSILLNNLDIDLRLFKDTV